MYSVLRYLSSVGEEEEPALDALQRARVNWPRCMPSLREQRLIPLLHERLRRGNALDVLPDAIANMIERDHQAAVAAQIVFQKSFLNIVAACDLQGIRVLPLKGIYLAEYIYPGVGTRPMTDLDILVAAEHFEPCVETLRENGYTCDLDFLARRGHKLPSGVTLHDLDRNVRVDVHCSLLNTQGIRGLLLSDDDTVSLDAAAMDTAMPRPYLDRNVHSLAPHVFLLALMLHHYTHNFEGLMWYMDSVYAARAMDDDQQSQFRALLRRFSLRRMAAVYFMLTVRNLGCAAESFVPLELAASSRRICDADPLLHATVAQGRLSALAALNLVPSLERRARSIARYMFPAREYIEAITHKELSGFDYIRELIKFRRRVLMR